MEISTSTNIVAFTPGRMRNPMDFCIRQCAGGGYRVLDINFCEAMNPWSRMREEDWEVYVAELAALGRECGIVFRQSHLPYYDIFRQPERNATMEMLIERSIRASGMLGVRWAVTHPGTVYDSADPEVSMAANLNYYRCHLETARSCGIGLCLENDFGMVPGQPGRMLYCSDVRELTSLADAFHDPEHMGICYDFGHANLCPGADHRKNLNHIGHRLRALHVQDNHGSEDEHLMPFHGTIDWKTCMEALADIRYQGDLTFEIQEFGRYLPNDNKHLVVEYSRKVGDILLKMYRDRLRVNEI